MYKFILLISISVLFSCSRERTRSHSDVPPLPSESIVLEYEDISLFKYTKSIVTESISLTPQSSATINLSSTNNDVIFSNNLDQGVLIESSVLSSSDYTLSRNENNPKQMHILFNENFNYDKEEFFDFNILFTKNAFINADNLTITNPTYTYRFSYQIISPVEQDLSISFDESYQINNQIDHNDKSSILEPDKTQVNVISKNNDVRFKSQLNPEDDYIVSSENLYFDHNNLTIAVGSSGQAATITFLPTTKEYTTSQTDIVSLSFLPSAFISNTGNKETLENTTAKYNANLTLENLTCSTQGLILDQFSDPLINVEVTVKDSSSVSSTTISDSFGRFNLNNLACGIASLDIEHPKSSYMGMPHGLLIKKEINLVLNASQKEVNFMFYNDYDRAIENSNNATNTTVTNFKKTGEAFAWGNNLFGVLGLDSSLNDDCNVVGLRIDSCITSPKQLDGVLDQYFLKRATGITYSHFLLSDSKTSDYSNDLYFTGYSYGGVKGDDTLHDDGIYITKNIEKVDSSTTNELYNLVASYSGTTVLGDNLTGLYSSGVETENGLFLGRDATASDHFNMFSSNNDNRGDISLDNAKITQVASGHDFLLFLSSDGILYATGSNEYGQLGVDSSDVSHPDFEIDKNKFIDFHHKAIRVKDAPTDIIKIFAGTDTAGAITSSGELWLWGNNKYAQISGQTSESVNRPSLINFSNGKKIKEAPIGNSIYVITTDNEVLSWGKNDKGQLAIGFESNSESTVQDITSKFSEEIEYLGAGLNHGIFQGTSNIYTVGSNESGQLGDGTRNNRSSAYRVNLP